MAKIETNLTADQVKGFETLMSGGYAVTLGKRDGNPTQVVIPVTDFPPNVIAAIFAYGVQRKFNDSVGGSDRTIEDKVTGVNELIEQFKRGEVRAARVAGEAVDPFVAAVRAVLRPFYKKAWIAAPGNSAEAWKGLEESAINEALDAQYAKLEAADKTKVDAAANAKLEAARIEREGRAGLNITL